MSSMPGAAAAVSDSLALARPGPARLGRRRRLQTAYATTDLAQSVTQFCIIMTSSELPAPGPGRRASSPNRSPSHSGRGPPGLHRGLGPGRQCGHSGPLWPQWQRPLRSPPSLASANWCCEIKSTVLWYMCYYSASIETPMAIWQICEICEISRKMFFKKFREIRREIPTQQNITKYFRNILFFRNFSMFSMFFKIF